MRESNIVWVSFFNDLRSVYPVASVSLEVLFGQIRSSKWKSEIANCRVDLTKKKSLPCFTPSGVFTQRNSMGISRYSGIICLDIDNLTDPVALKQRCKDIPWIWCSFITPSGCGLKIFVRTKTEQQDFKYVENEIAMSFYNLTGLMRDDRAKDLARLQFVSHDVDLFLNPDAIFYDYESQ